MENVVVVLLTLLTLAALIHFTLRPTYNAKLRRNRRTLAGETKPGLRSAKQKITGFVIAATCVVIFTVAFYFVPWAKIAPIILAIAIALTAIVLLGGWMNSVTYIWPTENGEVSQIVHRRVRRTLQTEFSSYLIKHGFKLIVDPRSSKELDFWFAVFRSEFFDLSIGGRAGNGVYGRPRYCQEDWYSIPSIFALLDGVNDVVPGAADLERVAQTMDVRHAELVHFFSAQGNETRLKFGQWSEKEFWRRMGRDDVPRDAT